MPGTASTRTATRWRWCDGASRETGSPRQSRAAASRLPHPASLLGSVALLTACSQLVFTPSPGWSRLTPGGLRDEGDAELRAECPRLLNRRPTGEARLSLRLDTSGAVTRVVMERGTGDERMDDILGRLAVRLQFEPARGDRLAAQTIGATMGYSCASTGSAITFHVVQPPAPERPPADTTRRPPG